MNESTAPPPMDDDLRHRLAHHGLDWIVPDWPAPSNVRAVMTTRSGGVGRPPFDTLNLGIRCGDDRASVVANRTRVAEVLGCLPLWLHQVHGTAVVDAESDGEPIADAAVSSIPGRAPAVLVADCLPVLLCDRDGRVVAVAHAGWRGLAAGVVEAAVRRIEQRMQGAVRGKDLLAWLGPAIGPSAFEVGDDVRQTFVDREPAAYSPCFVRGRPGKWYADLYAIARRRLADAGVVDVHGGGRCTLGEPDAFFSYRRDRRTGRMAALIWLHAGH